MGVSVTTGIVSGTDYEALITGLVSIESQPLVALAKKEASYQAKITGYGTLKSSLAEFQTAMRSLSSTSKYQTLKATVADTAVATVSASSIAKSGTYSLKVSQLAQAQKLVAAGQANATAAIGEGTTSIISFDFGTISIPEGGSFDEDTGKYTGAAFKSSGSGVQTVTIDSTNNSLTGIRDAINDAGIGVTATIVNDGSDTPYRLALTVDDSGVESSLKISVAGDDALSELLSHDPAGTQGFEETASAQNAKFTVDGIAISKASNVIGDVISGLTLTLLKTNSDSATSIGVVRDTSAISSGVDSFVTAYNALNTALAGMTSYDKETEESGLLNGDSTTRNIQNQIRKVLTSAVSGGSGTLTRLSQIGVSVQKDGSLALDSTKLQTALTDNFSSFAGLFASGGSATDSLVSYSASTSSTKPGNYSVEITQLATQGNIVASSVMTDATTITSSNNTLEVTLDGVTETITLAARETAYTNAELVTEIQSRINGTAGFSSAGLSATVSLSDTGGLIITSNSYGSSSSVAIGGGTARSLLGLGISATSTDGLDVAGKIGGVEATGSGQILTASSGDAEGISVNVLGGAVGNRGSVSYSQGYAYQLNTLLTSILDGEDGSIATRIEGLNSSIKDLGTQEERIKDRVAAIEARYRTQFVALETMLSSMTTTSNFLTQQLEALANLRQSN